MRKLFLAGCVSFALSLSSPAQTSRHPFTFDDAAALHSAHPTAVSPDGKTILYAVTFGAAKGHENTSGTWWTSPAPTTVI